MRLGLAAAGEAASGLDPLPPPIGPYVPVELVGQGGMGLVYLAEQREPIQRKVALKLIKPGIDSREVIRRFEAERETLALMDHPGIARVLDAGATERGHPYFVMEYVHGLPLVEYCDRNRLDTRQRLSLFVQVCDAVQHAHHKGIIHRDLKPSNLLVASNGEARPMVIDFGVAKATAPTSGTRTTLTRHGQVVGTPAYMSPEQADPTVFDIDTRSDVYSLGVVLYELLAGALPFDADESGVEALPKRILEEEPPRPSRRVSTLGAEVMHEAARNRSTDPGRLSRSLRGDLDWIVMKALSKDRERRYQAPAELAADIERHLRSDPVTAGPPGIRYRLGKFVRRHRLGVAAAGVIALAVVLGSVGLAVGWVKSVRSERRAREAEALAVQQAEEARQVSKFLTELFEESDPGNTQGTTVSARELLDRGAERIESELQGQPVVRAAMLNTIGWVYRNLGFVDEAQPKLERALEIRERELGANHPDVGDTLTKLALLVQIDRGNFDEAEPMLRRALTIAEQAPDPDDERVAEVAEYLASLLTETGRFDDAEPLLERSLRIREAHAEDYPLGLTLSLTPLASLYAATGRNEEALELQVRALEVNEANLPPTHPAIGIDSSNLAMAYMRLGRYDEAEPLLHRAVKNMEVAFGPKHPQMALPLGNLGVLYFNLGRFEDAIEFTRPAMEIRRESLGEDHPDYALSLLNLGAMEAKLERYDEAIPLFRSSAEIMERAFGDDHPLVASILANLGECHRELGELDVAERLQRRSMELREKRLGPDHVNSSMNLYNLGLIEFARGRPSKAESFLRRALEIRETALGPDHPDVADVLGELARAARKQSRAEEARALLERAIEIRSAATPDHPELARLRRSLEELSNESGP